MLIVQKYGGTSVGSVERIRSVARRVARFRREGNQLVVVVSAMAGETNRLLALAHELSANPHPREIDVVAATGEQVTIGLLAIALHDMGLKARSYTGARARRLDRITFEEMLELASQGSKVLQIRSVEFAGKYKVKLRVLSSFEDPESTSNGTLITFEEDEHMEQAIISGIASNRDEAKISLMGVEDRPGIAYAILGPIAAANVDVDMIVQNIGASGHTDFSFTVNRGEYQKALDVLEHEKDIGFAAREIIGDNKICKVSLVGIGMRSHVGIAAKMFKSLAEEGINIQMISTSEIKTSVVIDEKYLELAVRVLHRAFELEQAPKVA